MPAISYCCTTLGAWLLTISLLGETVRSDKKKKAEWLHISAYGESCGNSSSLQSANRLSYFRPAVLLYSSSKGTRVFVVIQVCRVARRQARVQVQEFGRTGQTWETRLLPCRRFVHFPFLGQMYFFDFYSSLVHRTLWSFCQKAADFAWKWLQCPAVSENYWTFCIVDGLRNYSWSFPLSYHKYAN